MALKLKSANTKAQMYREIQRYEEEEEEEEEEMVVKAKFKMSVEIKLPPRVFASSSTPSIPMRGVNDANKDCFM
ncbi:hypothetical protein FNV43_RR10001 [Rhamnella rubrinervis]|uniref:Uncharacterized protein n=1 Tax=Rhamnella rubrinervis TaxID=2594499 RepID=A0A8K0MKQ7_9ROSA|nr:hypothetical protein FNV43_RR10001 [Rhamnella rubrinervis]